MLEANGRVSSCFCTHAESRLPILFWLAIGISALTAAHAVLDARGLVYDGSFYLLGIAATRGFQLVEPARLSVQVLQQLPAVLGARLGVQSLWLLGELLSLGMSGWPVAITAMCWFVLPRPEKHWLAGPLVTLVFAIPAANFIAVSEGIIASSLLWLAVLLVMFRLGQPLGASAALVASCACALAHEAAIICLLLLAWLAAAQFKVLRFPCRFMAALVVVASITGAMYMARWIVEPRSPIERGDFLVSLLGGFVGSPAAPNMAAIASILAALFVAAVLVARRWSTAVAALGVAVVLACGILFAFAPDALASPSRFFAARGLPVIVTTILVGAFIILRRRGVTPAPILTRPVLAVVLALILAQAMIQETATAIWHDYVTDLRALVTSNRGVISHKTAMVALGGDDSRFRRELLESWSVEPLGILLAPAGRITAVVEPAPAARWSPYHWNEPRSLPHMPQLDWSHFAPSRAF